MYVCVVYISTGGLKVGEGPWRAPHWRPDLLNALNPILVTLQQSVLRVGIWGRGVLPRIPLEQSVATRAGRGLRGSCSLWPLITGLALIAGPHSVIAGHSWSVLLFYGFFYARMASIRHSWSVLLLFGLFYAARRSHLYSVLQWHFQWKFSILGWQYLVTLKMQIFYI